MNAIGYVYALATVLAMLAYGADKVAARSGGWRISEKTLLTVSQNVEKHDISVPSSFSM